MMLDREGALSIEDDIHGHIPSLPDYGHRVSLADLMANQSGIRDFLELRLLVGGNFADPVPAEEGLAMVEAMPRLNFEPGSDFAYSNTGFMLLTRVVEQVEGRPLEEVLQARIFDPLGMAATRLVRSDAAAMPTRALPYVETAAGLAPGLWGVPLDGAGGVISTIDDLLVWASNMRSPRVGSADIFAAMARSRPFSDGSISIYGYGLSVLPYRGAATFGHHGQLPGVYAEIATFPELDTTVALIANTSALNPFEIGRRIADAVLGDRLAALPPAPDGAAVAEGLYLEPERDAVLEIRRSGSSGALMATTSMTDVPLVAPAPGRLGLLWPMSLLDLTPRPGGALAGSAGMRTVRYQPIPPWRGAAPAVAGRFRQPDLRATWTIVADREGLRFRIEGPCGKEDFDLHPLAEGLFQARMREEPCGPYRPVLRLSGTPGRRRLTITTDRTFGLSATEVG
jgi:CubicO group peptidase (beta-lactamase class C family)